MSVYYNFIVKTEQGELLEKLLHSLADKYPLSSFDLKNEVALLNSRNGLQRALDFILGRSVKKFEIGVIKRFCRPLGCHETVIPSSDKVQLDLHAFGHKPELVSDKNWYLITTTIDHADGGGNDKKDFAEHLSTVCERVCWKPDSDGDQYSETYWDAEF